MKDNEKQIERAQRFLNAMERAKPILASIIQAKGGVVREGQSVAGMVLQLAFLIGLTQTGRAETMTSFDGRERFSPGTLAAITAIMGAVLSFLQNLAEGHREGQFEEGSWQDNAGKAWLRISGQVQREINQQEGGRILGPAIGWIRANAGYAALLGFALAGVAYAVYQESK